MQVRRLYLYPRFHGAVVRSLQVNQPEVIELSLELSEPMGKVQSAIIVALDACLSELKRALPHHDASLFTLKNGMFGSFDRTLRLLLGIVLHEYSTSDNFILMCSNVHMSDPEFHRLSWRTKQLVNDASTIRRLLDYLIRYDAVAFYMHLLQIRSQSASSQAPAMWLTTVAAEKIFQYSRERVFTEVPVFDETCEAETDKGILPYYSFYYLGSHYCCLIAALGSKALAVRLQLRNKFSLVLELPPKWGLLKVCCRQLFVCIDSRFAVCYGTGYFE